VISALSRKQALGKHVHLCHRFKADRRAKSRRFKFVEWLRQTKPKEEALGNA
jgi:hypothetical protein